MKHLGDITKINAAEIEPVDCITFGSPCQDLSVAGKRKGLEGERSGLFMEAVRIIKEMRENELERIRRSGGSDESVRPRFCIWENVPGAFSSNKGEDFRIVLEELANIAQKGVAIPRPTDNKGGYGKWQPAGYIEADTWSIAWRTFDAQYWGVPQRRKRIALVMDFNGRCAGEILFEPESMSGDIEQGIKTWKGVARNPKERARECGYDSYTLKVRTGADTYMQDGKIRGAGKGPLVQNELSATLAVSQDQTLFS